MNPNRVDFLVDLAYGIVILSSVALILIPDAGTGVGVAFGIGALISYAIHVVWKMARFDPEWMTQEVTEKVEETLTEEMTEEVTEEVTESVEQTVAEEVTEKVERTVTEEVTENVERTISEEVDDIIEQLEQVNERVDRRPRSDQIDAMTRDDAETTEEE
ncbi:hypothetical protein [Haloplanus halophilus]|uniref:hypothetical protein n=1 Tax=Haloplanus halophilus TaxID=2949993 RepID=UPI00203B4B87|nr:hypothetical protein [Haloplanus sp. GDY1]